MTNVHDQAKVYNLEAELSRVKAERNKLLVDKEVVWVALEKVARELDVHAAGDGMPAWVCDLWLEYLTNVLAKTK